ncbi:hypothetical protein [Pseudomonas fluorescens]|uniref:hypothetical protein n=1 Tax=Pseudomonas fluorescens TaxID=294 RepID=UPI003D1CC8D6
MSLSLTAVDCPASQKDLLDSLVLLYGRLGEIAEGRRDFGGFTAHGDLAEKFHLRIENYPRLTMRFSDADRNALASYAGMSGKELLACATTPLERLMIATLWKQADLGKIRYIAAGLVENGDTTSSNHTETNAPIFRQFGRHLSDPGSQPIADQHCLRAYRYLLGQDLCDGRHKLDTVKAQEVKSYVEWVQDLANRDTSDGRTDRMYEFDRSMFTLGKATKYLIDMVIPSRE